MLCRIDPRAALEEMDKIANLSGVDYALASQAALVMGDYEQAIAHATTSSQQPTSNLSQYGRALAILADGLLGAGAVKTARDYLIQSLNLLTSERDLLGAVRVRNNLGVTLHALGEPEQAISILQIALQDLLKMQDDAALSVVRHNLNAGATHPQALAITQH